MRSRGKSEDEPPEKKKPRCKAVSGKTPKAEATVVKPAKAAKADPPVTVKPVRVKVTKLPDKKAPKPLSSEEVTVHKTSTSKEAKTQKSPVVPATSDED